jgi:hypothetical protein
MRERWLLKNLDDLMIVYEEILGVRDEKDGWIMVSLFGYLTSHLHIHTFVRVYSGLELEV